MDGAAWRQRVKFGFLPGYDKPKHATKTRRPAGTHKIKAVF
jgi:hypothetical protein